MDVQVLIGEVARRHNVLVDPSDPIFVTVTLNELLLGEHVRKLEAALDAAEQRSATASARNIDAARRAATQLLTDGGRQAGDHVRAAGTAIRAQLEQVVRDSLLAAEGAALDAARSRRRSTWAAAAALAGACVALGTAIILWVRSA